MSTNTTFIRDDITDPVISNNSSLHTDYGAYKSSPGSVFYSAGGFRDSKLKCQFVCESPNMGAQGHPSVIELDLSPTGVSWDYNLRYQIYNTYGGQVVQILGVDISGLTITGRFGFESWFGKKFDGTKSKWGSLYNDISTIGQGQQYVWDNDPSVKNGLMQMAHWFRAYFNSISQNSVAGDGYDQFPMYFSFPHRGWWWPIRPRSFPSIKFSQQDYAPVWTVQADYLQYLQDTKIQNNILADIQQDINTLTPGVGTFTDFLNFSQPKTGLPSNYNIQKYTSLVGTNYGSYLSHGANNSLNTTGAQEAVNLYNNGMSFVYSSSFLTDLGIKI
jgi:hypothetical protein